MLKFTINIKSIHFTFEFTIEIFNYLICGYKYEYHKILNYNYKSQYQNSTTKKTKSKDIFKYNKVYILGKDI